MALTFATHDIVPDSPTNNFATLNPLIGSLTGTMADGNLKYTMGSVHDGLGSNFYVSSGKYYWETYFVSKSVNELFVGISSIDEPLYESSNIGNYDYKNTIRYYSYNGNIYYHNGTTWSNASYGNSFAPLDIIGVFLNLDDNELYFYKNGNVQNSGTPINIDSSTYDLGSLTIRARYDDGGQTSNPSSVFVVNFGQDPTFAGSKTPSTTYTDANGIGAFYYQPPTDALALCTANLPDFTPTVTEDTPQDYFKTVTYIGQTTGGALNWDSNTETGTVSVGFQPDLVWAKRRDYSAAHVLVDSVRGARQTLSPNASSENLSEGSGKTLLSFDSGGFTVGTDGDYYTSFTASGSSIVAWCWKAGGAPTADNSNTSGAMTANSVSLNGTLQSNYTPAGSPTIYPKRMSINTDVGFSIVKYVGDGSTNNSSPATVPSGLSDVDVVLVKNLDYGSHPNQANNVCNWQVYHKSLSSNHNLLLDVANAEYDITASGAGGIQVNNGNLQLITRTVSQTWNANVNDSGDNYIAYCWHSVEGYSKFGSYTGNGSADGPFVYTGFRPAFVICKCSSDTTTTNTSWAMYDNARDSSNVMNKVLYVNQNIKEGYRGDASTAATDIYIDFLSNGFKVRSTKEEVNDSGETYIFMAFAEQPFKFSNAR